MVTRIAYGHGAPGVQRSSLHSNGRQPRQRVEAQSGGGLRRKRSMSVMRRNIPDSKTTCGQGATEQTSMYVGLYRVLSGDERSPENSDIHTPRKNGGICVFAMHSWLDGWGFLNNRSQTCPGCEKGDLRVLVDTYEYGRHKGVTEVFHRAKRNP